MRSIPHSRDRSLKVRGSQENELYWVYCVYVFLNTYVHVRFAGWIRWDRVDFFNEKNDGVEELWYTSFITSIFALIIQIRFDNQVLIPLHSPSPLASKKQQHSIPALTIINFRTNHHAARKQ